MKGKIVYADGDYTKVLRGSFEIKNDFVEVVTESGKKHLIGKKFIISISGGNNDD